MEHLQMFTQNSDGIFHYYYFHLFSMANKIILILLCLLVPQLFQPIVIEGKAPEHFIWLNFSSSQHLTILGGYLNFPKAGFASYFQSRSHLKKSQQPILKKYFNLYETSLQLLRTSTIVCEQSKHFNFCQNISNSYLYSNDQKSRKSSIGGLVENNQLQKSLHFNDGSVLRFYQRNEGKELIQYFLVVLICFIILILQVCTKQKIIVDSVFFVQFFVALSTYLYYCSDYVKEAIENWNDKQHQFWLFIPLTLISYKLIQSIAQRSLTKPIPILHWLVCFSVNFCLLYLIQTLPLFQLVNYALTLRCRIRQQKQNQQESSHRKGTRQAQKRLSFCYTLINIALVFRKLWLYCISIHFLYFLLRMSLIGVFYLFFLNKTKANQKLQEMIQSKYKVKIILTKKQLNLQLPSLDMSNNIDQQCPICYERILFKWAKTPCGHIFHDRCLYKWLQKSETCPIDRKRVINDKICKEAEIIQSH